MLARFDRDVADRRPQWLVLNCGVNDVWHRANGCTVGEFRANVMAMLDRAESADVAVLCTTATVCSEDLDGELNRRLADYNATLREIAATRQLRLAECNGAFQDALRAPGVTPGSYLTVDGVHFNDRGEALMASAVLAGFGIDASRPGQP